MSILVIVLIILIGLLLILLELFVIPGVTVAGILGLLFCAGGIYLSYYSLGSVAGNVTLVSTLVVSLLGLVWSLKSGSWKALALDSTIRSQVETVEDSLIKVGQEGLTVTRLNPVGKVRVGNEMVEGRCPGQFVDPKKEVIVQKVYKTYIIVKPKIESNE